MSGYFTHSLVAAYVCAGWPEAVPLLEREQALVVKRLEPIGGQLPFPNKGVDLDNDSAFINDTLIGWCADRSIKFTGNRAYRKNDQAWIEQKNRAEVRRFAGHDRYSGQLNGQTMVHLYRAIRLSRRISAAWIRTSCSKFRLNRSRKAATWVERSSRRISSLDAGASNVRCISDHHFLAGTPGIPIR